MKIQATSTFETLAKGTAKEYNWRVYARQVANLSTSLSGSWTEITSRLSMQSFPDINTRIEFLVGQFTSDNVSLTGKGISYFKNLFELSGGNLYVELKVELDIVGASDVIPMFAGFLDIAKGGIQYNELKDSVTFEVFTVDDLGTRMAAEHVSAQPIKTDVTGSSDGLILPNIINLYVIDANVASYPLKVGTHTIAYDQPTNKLSLDGGLGVTASGTVTLGNGASAPEDTERVTVFVGGTLPAASATDDIVVLVQGTTLPKRWYKDMNVRLLLTKLYERLGITSLTFDDLEFRTWNAAKRLFYIDTPPNNDGVVIGDKFALESDGTDLFVSFNDKVYQRDKLTGTYTLVASGVGADKLIYNARNNHLWMWGGGELRRLDLNTSTLSSAVIAGEREQSIQLIDYNYTGSSYKYGILYTEESGDPDRGRLKFVDGSSLGISSITTGATLSYTVGNGIRNHFMYIMSGGKFRFRVYNNIGEDAYREHQVDGSGAFVDNGEVLAGIDDYREAAYNAAEERVYYKFTVVKDDIRSHTDTDATATTVYDGSSTDSVFGSIYYSPSEYVVYFTLDEITGFNLYQAAINVDTFLAEGLITTRNQMVFANDRLYLLGNQVTGLNTVYYGVPLYQWSDQVVPNVVMADLEGATVTETIRKVMNGYSLIGTISANKSASVYRRGDSSGIPRTSGKVISVTAHETADIEEVINHHETASLVSVSNGTDTVTYNGTDFDVAVLSDKYVISISNDFLPGSILKDIAYYVYQFFKTRRSLYKIPLAGIALFQYEPFDEANVSFDTTGIQRAASGPIYAVRYGKNATMSIEVLL